MASIPMLCSKMAHLYSSGWLFSLAIMQKFSQRCFHNFQLPARSPSISKGGGGENCGRRNEGLVACDPETLVSLSVGMVFSHRCHHVTIFVGVLSRRKRRQIHKMAIQDQQPFLAPRQGLYNMTNKTGNEAPRLLLQFQCLFGKTILFKRTKHVS